MKKRRALKPISICSFFAPVSDSLEPAASQQRPLHPRASWPRVWNSESRICRVLPPFRVIIIEKLIQMNFLRVLRKKQFQVFQCSSHTSAWQCIERVQDTAYDTRVYQKSPYSVVLPLAPPLLPARPPSLKPLKSAFNIWKCNNLSKSFYSAIKWGWWQ